MSASESVTAVEGGRVVPVRLSKCLHMAWQVSLSITIATGLFHMLNLIGEGRLSMGAALLTPYRLSFVLSWVLLGAMLIVERRRPRLETVDYLVAGVAVFFLIRGLFLPDTFGTVINWVVTGAGMFYLVRHGIRNSLDVRLVLVAVTLSVLVIAAFGLIEYFVKSNPLFDAIQVDVIGIDSRVGASNQFYRIRSLVGHPGFVAAIVLTTMPLALLVFWRRRVLMAGSLLVLVTALFFTFSRGSWVLAFLVFVPLIAVRARYWLFRNLKWLVPVALLPVIFIAFDYFTRDEIKADLPGYNVSDTGLHWSSQPDGPVVAIGGESTGLQPINKYLYFNVDDSFMKDQHDAVTVVIHYFDKGTGALHVDYDSWDDSVAPPGATPVPGFHPTFYVQKSDTRQWTTAAFYLSDPRFDNREGGNDFRIVDDDSLITVDQVVLQKGKLKLPTMVAQQWMSRAGSISTRFNLYPFAWGVLKANPLGVGLYDTPGTNNHAVDSLPLTWMMEFGWLGLPLLLGLVFIFIFEGVRVVHMPRSSAAVLYGALFILTLHGAFVMILYDKPSLVLAAVLAAVYSVIRPWRRGGMAIDADNENCMI